MDELYVVLSYDVVDDRERARFFRRLKRYLVPVQKSVFEGTVSRRELARVEALVHRELTLEQDSVRVWLLCATCQQRIRHHGTAAPVPDPDAPLVF